MSNKVLGFFLFLCVLVGIQDGLSNAGEIPKADWTVLYVNSEELVYRGGAPAEYAFDEYEQTFWHTQNEPTNTPPPHEIQIDLGSEYVIEGFRYLPSQEYWAATHIGQYEFYISTNGTDWGIPVATGTFISDATAKEVICPATTGRYIRLLALTEASGFSCVSIAELDLLTEDIIPSVQIVEPKNFTLFVTNSITVSAEALLDSELHGDWGVKFVLDSGSPSDKREFLDFTPPFETTFSGLEYAEYEIEATLIDGAGIDQQSDSTRDRVIQIGIGDYYVAIGDSITDGVGDDDPSDNISIDGRNVLGGYEPILNDLLTETMGYPQIIVGEGVGGDKSIQGLALLPSILEKHPDAQRYLILFGTNDTNNLKIDSGLGLNPEDPGYEKSFKGNMQQIISMISDAGKIPIIAKVPPAFGDCSTCEPYLDPDSEPRNLLTKEYNKVIDGLVVANGIEVVPPNFYTYFQAHQDQFADRLHPDGRGYQTMAEMWHDALVDSPLLNQRPNSEIVTPVTDLTINPGDAVDFSGLGADPDDDLPLTYLWLFGVGSGVPDSMAMSPGMIQFDNPGTYTVTFTVTDSLGVADPTPATVVVHVRDYISAVIPKDDWTLQYVDSEEPVYGGGGPGLNAIDDSEDTCWFTQYQPISTPPPHEIQIDLGQTYKIDGFRYLPSQQYWNISHIGSYEFYVSADGIDWGEPMITGTFNGDATEKEVGFAGRTGRYVRLVALTEVSGKPFTSIAEINLLGGLIVLPNDSPDGEIVTPVGKQTITAGESLGFTGSGSDPDNDLPLTYLWQFGAGSGVGESMAMEPGQIRFDNPGTYTVTFTVTDSLGLSDPTPATRTIEVLDNPSSTISKEGWTIKYVDSEEPVYGGGGPGVNAIDDSVDSFWFTQYLPTSTPPPHEIQIDLGQTYEIDGFRYLPSQQYWDISHIGSYEFYVSADGVGWGTPVATGTFTGDATEKEVVFTAVSGRFVRLRALTEVNGFYFTSVADINIIGRLVVVNEAPDSEIVSPAANQTITVGESMYFTGSGSDPENDLPLKYMWQFGAGSGVADITAMNPGLIRFDNPGTYTITFTVTDSLGLADPTPATRTIKVVDNQSATIPKEGWTLQYVDSEELVYRDGGPGINAIDDSVDTFWFTQYLPTSTPPPHEIQIDLGQDYEIDGFCYLPSQVYWNISHIGSYEFYVSADGVDWGTPVATGTFIGDATEKEVVFTARSGRFVRLRALTEVNGFPFTSIAEIAVIGKGMTVH